LEARLKSGIAVKALVRRCDIAAIGVAVTRRGDADAGAILIKLIGRDGLCAVLAQARRADGSAAWLRATGVAAIAEGEADAYIERQRRRDPDLWVVEVESDAAETFLDNPVIA
jgi:hypothetical protein